MQAAAKTDPLATFWQQEERHGSTLVATIDDSLSALTAAMSTAAPLPAALASTATTILHGNVPAPWAQIWSGPSEPLPFLRATANRVSACRTFSTSHANPAALKSTPLPLTQVFSPLGLLSAVRQLCAHAQGVSVDTLVLRNSWNLDDLAGHCSYPLTVTGLHLEGAAFDGQLLTAVGRFAPAATPLPPVTLAWVAGGSAELFGGQQALKMPVYSRANREVELLELDFPVRSTVSISELVLAGAAAFVGT
jgi:hypothetical protein